MYPSNDNMSLKGSLYFPEGDGPFPAIVYCHGGFSLDDQDVDRTNVLLKAGFAVYAPTWRGENGNPGNYELCMGEAADCVAAMEYLARREDIDPESIFLVGHSLGAINAMLAAELSTRPRGVVAIGGMLDMHGLHRFQTTRFIDEIPYYTSDDKEELLRSPAKFLADLSCPMRIVYGDKEFVPAREQGKAIAAASSQLGKKVEYVELPGKDHFSSLVPALGDAAAYFQQLMKQPRQTPAPVFEDRTPEWLAQQIASFPSQVGERRAVVPLLNAAWTAKPDPGPEQDFSPLFELAEEYGIGTPILAGPKQWWSISIDDKAIVIRDLANRTSHRLTGRRTLVDDKSWGGASGFVALSPDGKSLLWLMEGKGDVNNLPKQHIYVQQTQDLVTQRTIDRAYSGQYLSANDVLIARPTFIGKTPDFLDERQRFRLPYALRRVKLRTGEESAEIAVRAGGVWSISPGKNLVAVAHPTDSELSKFLTNKETFSGQTESMELMIIDVRSWSVISRGEYRDIPSGRSLAWSSDGKQLASIASDGSVGLWDIATGQGAALTGLGKLPPSVASPYLRFLDNNRMLLVNDTHLLQVADGQKVAALKPAPGSKIEFMDWIGDRYRPRFGGVFLPFPFDQLRADLSQALDSSTNLLADRKIELTFEAAPGEQVAPEALEFVRKQLPDILKRRFDLTVVENDGKPHMKAKVQYGEKMEYRSVAPKVNGRVSHVLEPLNRGGKQTSRLTFELATPDGRVVHTDSSKSEVTLPMAQFAVSPVVQLRTMGLLEAVKKFQGKLPMTVPHVEGQVMWPKTLELSVSPPAKLAWNLPETTGAVGQGAAGATAAAASPETANLPARLAIQPKEKANPQSSRYSLGILSVGDRPTLVIHGIRGDTEWIALDEPDSAPATTSLGEGFPAFSPTGSWVAKRANMVLELQSIGAGVSLSEAKTHKFPANILALAWSRTGKLLAVAMPNVIEVYDAEALRAAASLSDVQPVTKLEVKGLVTEMNFSVDERRIVAVEAEQALLAFDVTNGMQVGRFAMKAPPTTGRGAPARGQPSAAVVGGGAFSADGTKVYGLMSGVLVAFDLATGQPSGQWPIPDANTLLPSPDGRWLAILQSTQGGQLRRSDKPEDWRSLTLETKNRVITNSIIMKGAWSGDGQIFAATNQRGTTTAWDAPP